MSNPHKNFSVVRKKEYMQIDPQQEYSLYQVAKHDLLKTGASTYQACRSAVKKILHNDSLFDKFLQPRVEKADDGKLRYHILGANIVKYILKKGLH